MPFCSGLTVMSYKYFGELCEPHSTRTVKELDAELQKLGLLKDRKLRYADAQSWVRQ